VRTGAPRLRAGDLLGGWRYILTHPALRPLFFNTILVNGLIMATSPLLAVLMLGRLGFAPWQYGLAFGAPCAGGLIGSRLARRLVVRFGRHRVMLTAGALRACWSLGLAFTRPGAAGLVLVIAAQLGLITCMGVFNPVFATYRLEQTATDRVARTLSAWSVTSNATIAALTALWGLLASITSPRTADRDRRSPHPDNPAPAPPTRPHATARETTTDGAAPGRLCHRPGAGSRLSDDRFGDAEVMKGDLGDLRLLDAELLKSGTQPLACEGLLGGRALPHLDDPPGAIALARAVQDQACRRVVVHADLGPDALVHLNLDFRRFDDETDSHGGLPAMTDAAVSAGPTAGHRPYSISNNFVASGQRRPGLDGPPPGL
jgi:nitrate reductase NapE component